MGPKWVKNSFIGGFGAPVAYPPYNFEKFWRHFYEANFLSTLRSHLNFLTLMNSKGKKSDFLFFMKWFCNSKLYMKYNNLEGRKENKYFRKCSLPYSVEMKSSRIEAFSFVNVNRISVFTINILHFLFFSPTYWRSRATANIFPRSKLIFIHLYSK